MTSDTRPKQIAIEFKLGRKTVRIGGMCKGAGMIQPGMSATGARPAALPQGLHATMLCFITTDAAIEAAQIASGGTTYAIGTVELTFPVGLPAEWGIEGAVFSDFGTVFGAPENSLANGSGSCDTGVGGPNCTVFDTAALRASIGAGIIWQSPFGPLRFEMNYPILKEKYDDTEWFRFSIGTRF